MPLAKKGDPYITRTGQAIISQDSLPEAAQITVGPPIARKIVSQSRRSLSDLPANDKTQLAIMVVLGFSLCGLSDNEISHITGASLEEVEQLKRLNAYQETFEIIFNEMISANSTSMMAKISAFAPNALESLIDVAMKGKQEVARVRAADSILDRSGLHHETLFGKNAKEDTGFDSLKIVIEDGEDTSSKINININKR